MFRHAPLFALSLLMLATGPLHASPDIVVLVRHAEKAVAEGSDPTLSEQGQMRAKALADALASAGITRIFATQYRRTQLTAAPLAERLGLQVDVIDASAAVSTYVAELAALVRSQSAGVLVVGHSNTIPALLRELGGPSLANLCESSFGHAFVVRLEPKPARVLHLRYGSDDPPPDGDCL